MFLVRSTADILMQLYTNRHVLCSGTAQSLLIRCAAVTSKFEQHVEVQAGGKLGLQFETVALAVSLLDRFAATKVFQVRQDPCSFGTSLSFSPCCIFQLT